MQSYFDGGAVADSEPPVRNPSRLAPGETVLERIRRTGELRVGYRPNQPPFAYRNDDGMLVGLEVDLAYRLAVELEAELRMVPYEAGSLDGAFAADHFDVAIGGLGSLVREAGVYWESDPYLELHAALVVPDYRADEFSTVSRIQQMDRVRVAYVEGGVLVRTGRHRIPGLEVVGIASGEPYLRGRMPEIDALLTTAETGAIHTMIFPEFSVVIPEGLRARVPLVVAVAADEALRRTVNRFVQIKRSDGTVETLYQHWILGDAGVSRQPRWSIIRDVLGWVD